MLRPHVHLLYRKYTKKPTQRRIFCFEKQKNKKKQQQQQPSAQIT